ncbi:putative membrane -like protein [Paraburkholderia xenovorans LB400]|jgi:hypothetical protein|nr:putative membrane -like protein [Paraburkholderia xenovorans LB400]
MPLRTRHHWTGVAYELDTMSHSVRVQASISVFWTARAPGMMMNKLMSHASGELNVLLHRHRAAGGERGQLFLFDLSHASWDRVDRIVYRHRVDVAADRPLSPLPPKA